MRQRIVKILATAGLGLCSLSGHGQSALEDIKPFDPVNMESRIGLTLDSYYFVAANKFFSLRPAFYYSIPNKRHLMGLSIPVVHSIFSGDFAGFENTTGIGDFKFTYVGVPYQSRDILGFQRVSAYLEVTAPTGNDLLGRGVGAWVYRPGLVFTYRPDVAFYFFPQVNFQFSTATLNSFGGGDALPDLIDPDKEDKLKVMTFSLPVAFALDAWDGWISLTPDYIHTFAEDTYFIFLKMELGKMISQRTSASLQITRFIAGQPRLETQFRVHLNFFLGGPVSQVTNPIGLSR
jgi:hypothetical protein